LTNDQRVNKNAGLNSSLISSSNPCFAQSDNTSPFSSAAQFVTELLNCYVQNEEVVGLTFAVAYKDKVVYSQAFGWADLENNSPVTIKTRFRFESVSKLFMAAAISKLSEEGQLDLDKPVRTYVPGFPEKRWPITTRQIAAHMGGIRGYQTKDFIDGQDIHQQKFATTEESLTIFANDSLLFEPGTGYQYSTFGFTLLTAVVENITGQAYEAYLKKEILLPLGIESVIPDRQEEIIPNRGRFYEPTKERNIENASPIRSDFKFAGGGLLGTAEDLTRLGLAHVKPGLFQANTLEEDLFVEQTRKNGRSVNIGLAWRIGIDEEFGKVYHHSGALPGARSVLMVWPEYELTIAATSNTTNAPYYAEQFAQTLSHVFMTALKADSFSYNLQDSKDYKLNFSDEAGENFSTMTLSPYVCSGSLEAPPLIVQELEKRGFPKVELLKVMGNYQNSDGSTSVILSSDIGLHRLQFTSDMRKGLSGFIVELVNKFEWEITKHQFEEIK